MKLGTAIDRVAWPERGLPPIITEVLNLVADELHDLDPARVRARKRLHLALQIHKAPQPMPGMPPTEHRAARARVVGETGQAVPQKRSKASAGTHASNGGSDGPEGLARPRGQARMGQTVFRP